MLLHSLPPALFIFCMDLLLPLLLHPRRVCSPFLLQMHGLTSRNHATEKLKNKTWGTRQPKCRN